MLSTFADLVDEEYRTVIFGFVYGIIGLAFIFSSFCIAIIEVNLGIQAVIYSYDITVTFMYITHRVKPMHRNEQL